MWGFAVGIVIVSIGYSSTLSVGQKVMTEVIPLELTLNKKKTNPNGINEEGRSVIKDIYLYF